MPPDVCPQCGAMIPERARACPDCGSDENTGWSDDAQADRLGLPQEGFDYDRYVEEEFDEPRKRQGPHWLWVLVAAGLAAWMLLAWIR
ncbi:MAG: zinc-ribbon domain-containing protein [Verrucomicrobia bacterium]|nr:zinc-ribbon domain-containing protein [Verrucomicrobiota bacterium]